MLSIVGADFSVNSGAGTIYIIPLDDTTLMNNIIAHYGKDGDMFGWSIAISGAYILVGAYLDDNENRVAGVLCRFLTEGTLDPN